MRKELGRILATGAIIGAGTLSAGAHPVSAGGGPEGTPGWSYNVDRQDYLINIPNPGTTNMGEEWNVYRVVSKTEDVKTEKTKIPNFNREFPFVHFKRTFKTEERGLNEGIKELQENCEVQSVYRAANGIADVPVKDTSCFTIYQAPPK